MDIEQTTEQQLLAESKKQTTALESLRGIAIVWSFFAVLAAVVLLISAIAAG